MPDERKAVTQVGSWRQRSLFTRAELKPFLKNRWKWIQARLREEGREKERDDAGGRLARPGDEDLPGR